MRLLSQELVAYKMEIDEKIKVERLYLDSDMKKYEDELEEAYQKLLEQKNKLLEIGKKVGFNYNKFRSARAALKTTKSPGNHQLIDFSEWTLEYALEKLIDFYRSNPEVYHAGLRSQREDGYFAFLDRGALSLTQPRISNAPIEKNKTRSDKEFIFPTNNRAPFGIFMNGTFTENDTLYLAYNSVGLEGNCSGSSHRKVACDLPYLALSMESNYGPPDGRRLMELNFYYISEDNKYSNRYLSFEVDNDTYFSRLGIAVK